MAQGGCRSILRAELGDLGSEAIHTSWTASPEMQPSGTTPRHLWFMAHDLCLLAEAVNAASAGWGMGRGGPLELCSIEPLLWEKDHCLGGRAWHLPVPSSGVALAAGCSPRLAGRLLLVAVHWGAGEGTAETSRGAASPSEPSTFPSPQGFFNVPHLSLKGSSFPSS